MRNPETAMRNTAETPRRASLLIRGSPPFRSSRSFVSRLPPRRFFFIAPSYTTPHNMFLRVAGGGDFFLGRGGGGGGRVPLVHGGAEESETRAGLRRSGSNRQKYRTPARSTCLILRRFQNIR